MPTSVNALLIQVCRALRRTVTGTCSGAVSRVFIGVHDLTSDQLESAIAVAAKRGWISTGGKPVHSVLLTVAGRAATAKGRRK